jgi:chromate transporter
MSGPKKTCNKRIKFRLFLIFFKIGLFTFGGGFAMLPLIEKEIVEKAKWITQEEICDIFAISQSFPGAIAINSATIIGHRIAGYGGAIFSTLGVVLPSFIVILVVANIFNFITKTATVIAALKSISASVVALLIFAAVRYARTSIKDKISPAITVIAAFIILFTKIHPLYTIIFGIAAGFSIHYIKLLIKRKKIN